MTIVFQTLTAIGAVGAFLLTRRILALVGRPSAGQLVLAGFALLTLRSVYALLNNLGQYDQHHEIVIAEALLTFFMLASGAGLYFIRVHARTKALSRLNPQPATAPAPSPAAKQPKSAPEASIEDAGDPQLICNSDMEVTDLNQGAARLLGRERDQICGKNLTSLVRKEEMLLVPELFRQAKAGEAHGGEWSFRKPDDSLVPVRISVHSHFGDQARLILQGISDQQKTAPETEAATAGSEDTQSDGASNRQASQILTRLLDASSEGCVAYDEDLKIVAWNARMEKLTGIPKAQCLGQHLLMHFPVPEELAEEDYFLEALEGHANDLVNATIINPESGDEDMVNHHFAPLLNDADEVIGGMVIVRQPIPVPAATETATADEAPNFTTDPEPTPEEEPTPIAFAMGAPTEAADEIRMDVEPATAAAPTAEAPADDQGEVVNYLNNIFANAPHIIAVYDLTEQRHIFFNRPLPIQLGFSAEKTEAMGDNYYSEIVHPEDQSNLPRTADAWNDGTNIEQRVTEFRAIDPERTWHWYLATDRVMERADDGTIKSIVSVIQDITEQKEAERQLRLGEQKYRTFSEHCPTGIWHLTAGGQTHYMNPAMCKILGVDSMSALEGRTYHEFITPDSQLSIATHSIDPAESDAPTIEVDLQRLDGTLRHCILHGIPDLDEAGNIRSLMGSFLDVTDRDQPVVDTAEAPEPVVAMLESPTANLEQPHYRAIVEQTPDLICRFDKDGKLSFVNGAYCGFFGQTRDDLLNGPFAPKISAAETEAVAKMLDSLDPVMQPQDFECRLLRVDGEERHTRWTLHAVSDDTGSFLEYQAIARDITEQVTAEAALAASERKYRGIFENTGIGIVAVHPDGRYVDANEAYAKITGYSVEELLEYSVADLTHPEDLAESVEEIKALASGRVDLLELDKRYVRKDGSIVWCHVAARAVRNEVGEVDHLIAAAQNITTNREAEAALRNSEEQFRLLCHHSPVAIFLNDADGKCTYLNPKCREIVGFDDSDDPNTWATHIHPEDTEELFGLWQDTMENGAEFHHEYRFQHPDGKVIAVRGEVIPERDTEGNITGYIGTLVDLTGLINVERQLESKEALLTSAIDSLPFDVWACDRDSRYILQNTSSRDRWGDRLGKKPEETGVAPEIVDIWHQHNHRALEGETVVDHVRYHHDKDMRDFQSIVGPIRQGDEIVGFLGANIDITDLKTAESRLAETETKLGDAEAFREEAEILRAQHAENLEKTEAELRELKVTLDERTTSLREAEETRGTLKADLEKAAAELSAAESDRDLTQGLLKETEADLADAKATLDETKTKLQKAATELEEKEAVRLEVETSKASTAEELTKVAALLAAAEAARDDHKSEVDSLKSKLTEITKANEDNQAELELTREALTEAEQAHARAQADLAETQNSLNEKDTTFLHISEAKTELEADLEKTKKALAETESERGNALESLARTQSELETTNAKIQELEAAASEASTKLSEAEKALQETNNKLGETESLYHELEAAQTESATRLSAAESKADELQSKLDQANESVTAAETARVESEKSLVAANNKLSETESHGNELETSLSDATNKLSEAEAKAAELQTQLDDFNAKLAETETARDRASSDLAALQSELQEAEAGKTAAEQEAKKANEKASELEVAQTETSKSLKELTDNLNETRSKLEAAETARDAAQSASSSDLKDAESKRTAAEAKAAELESKLSDADAARDKALQDCDNAQNELQSVTASLTDADVEREKAQSALDTVQTELDKLEERLTNTEHDLAETRSALEATEKDLASANAKLEEAEAVKLEVATSQKSATEELAKLAALLAAAEAARDENKSTLAATQETQAELDRTKETLNQAEKQTKALQSQLAEAQAELAGKTASQGEVAAELDSTKSQLRTVTAELQSAKTELTEAKEALEQSDTDLQSTKLALDEKTAALEKVQSDLQHTTSELKQTKSDFEAAKKTQNNTARELDRTRERASEAETKAAELQSELSRTKNALSSAEAARDQAESVLSNTESRLEKTKAALEEKEAIHLEVATSQNESAAELVKTQSQLTAAETDRDVAQTSLQEAQVELESLKATLSETQTARDGALAALNNTEGELKEARADLADEKASHSETAKSLEETKADLDETQASLAAAQDSLSETSSKLTASENELERTKGSLEEKEAARLEVECSKAESTEELAKVTALLSAAEAARDNNQAEVDALKSQLSETERARDEAQAALGKSNSDLEATKATLAEQEAVHEAVAANNSELGETLAAAEAALKEFETTRAEFHTNLEAAQKDLEDNKSALASTATERDELHARLTKTEAELEQIKSARSESESIRDRAQTELGKTQAELEQLRKSAAEIDSLRAALESTKTELVEAEAALAENETTLALAEAAAGETEAKRQAAAEELMEAKEALEVSDEAGQALEQQLSGLLYNVPGIAYSRPVGKGPKYSYISVGCAALTGHAPEEFTSGNVCLSNMIHPDDADRVEEAINTAIENQGRYVVDYRLTHKDGSDCSVTEQGCGVFKEDQLTAINAVITEVSSKATTDYSDSPINHLSECVWITDVHDRTVFVNQAWCDTTGNAPDSGLAWADAVHGEDRPAVIRAFKQAVADRERFDQEFRLRRADGEFLWMRMIAVPRRDSRNRFTGYLGSCFDISPNIREREEFKANQRQLEWAQTRAKLGSWEYHPEQNFRRWSKQTMDLYNRRPEEGLPADFQEFLEHIHEDDRNRLITTNDQVMSSGRAIGNLEFRTNPDKGPLRYLTATVYRVPEEDGSAYYLAGTVMDISDQKAAEENVRRSEERYRKIIEIAEEGVWMMDAEGYTSFVNPRMMQMLGYRYREFIGRHFFEFLENESIKDAEEYLERRQQGIAEQAEFKFLRKDGRAINVLINSSSLKDADGDFIGVLCMVSDITARKAATAKLDEAQKKIATVLATAPDFIMSVDNQKIIRFINRDYAGMEPEQVIGTPALNWITPEDRERYEEAIAKTFESGESQELEVKGLGAGGASAWYFTRIGPVKEGDEVTSLIIVSQDISQRKTAQARNTAYERRLKSLSKKLLAAQETERRWIANELHDQFGQALSATKINLQALAAEKLTVKNKKRVENSLASLEGLIEQTRELSHNLRPSILDDLGLVPALRWMATNQGDSAGYELEFDAPEIDRFDPDLEAAAFRVIQEALTNISRHAEAKKVRVKVARTGTSLDLEITDDGKGFDVDAALTTATEDPSLGLLGMEERVVLADGAFSIDSAVGKGTAITASIPVPIAVPTKTKRKAKPKAKKAARKKGK